MKWLNQCVVHPEEYNARAFLSELLMTMFMKITSILNSIAVMQQLSALFSAREREREVDGKRERL